MIGLPRLCITIEAYTGVPLNRSRDFLLLALFFLVGAGSAIQDYWPALTTYAVYHSDVRQAPHWAAYHGSSFRADDILVEYASHNESPLQNAIYFVATWFGDSIKVGKYLSVIGNGLVVALFFWVGRAMYGVQAGCLIATFYNFFPGAFQYSQGFYSKFWAAPLLLLCLFVLQTERRKWLLLLLPFAALAYPMTAFLIGMVCSVYLVMLWFSDRREAHAFFRILAIASVLALLPLLIKYVSPPEFLGPMFSRSELLTHPQGGVGMYIPIPSVVEELWSHLANVFIVGSAIGFLLILRRRGIRWERSWTALLLGSSFAYLIADLLFARLYIPNRYTRYSIAVLLALWLATNWEAVLAKIPRPILRYAALALVFAAAGFWFHGQSGRHVTYNGLDVVGVASFVRTLPEGVLLAGPPRYLDDIMIQGKRSVLSTYKLNHGWHAGMQETLHERTLAIYRAIYAPDESAVNDLYSRYGVTHLVVERSYFGARLKSGKFRSRYDQEIQDLVGARRRFLLRNPSEDSVAYYDGQFTVIELPLGGVQDQPTP